MKKTLYVVGGISVIFLLWYLYIAIFSTIYPRDSDRVRPTSIPETTYYLGGIDGGTWIDTLRRSDTLMLLVIYSEYSQMLDTVDFRIKPGQIFKQELKAIQGYNGEELIIHD